jgi:hypothetical protein
MVMAVDLGADVVILVVNHQNIKALIGVCAFCFHE